MNRLIVCLKKPCQVWALALAASLAFFACSNGDDVAGGVTDIGNSIAREPDTTKIAGTVVDMQGKRHTGVFTKASYVDIKAKFDEMINQTAGYYDREEVRAALPIYKKRCSIRGPFLMPPPPKKSQMKWYCHI